MTETTIKRLVQQIHAADGELVLATAGGGTNAVAWLLGAPGASRTVLEIIVPYSRAAFDDFLGRPAAQYASAQAGQWLAGCALARAQTLSDKQVIGVSCTAAIATDRPKKGTHRAHITLWTHQAVISHHLVLHKGGRTRAGEEETVSRVLLNSIAQAYGIAAQLPIAWQDGDRVTSTTYNIAAPLTQLYDRQIDWMGVYDTGRVRTDGISPQLLLSGSFNPLHAGHLALAQAASDFIGQPIAFELPMINADKPAVPQAEASRRLAQFAGRYPVYISNAPTFAEKTQLYGATTFVVGFDTAARILMPRFYNNSERDMTAALTQLSAQGGRFLVAGRIDQHGDYRAAETLIVPEPLQPLFIPLPNFRVDLSSTQLRRRP